MTWGLHRLGGIDSLLTVSRVPSGPNAGYRYLGARPGLQRSIIFLNPALDVVGEWANRQTGEYRGLTTHPQLGIPFCTKAAFALLKPHVSEHEGLTGADRSHYGIWQRLFAASDVLQKWESVVRAESDNAVADSVVTAFTKFVASPRARAAHDSLDTQDGIEKQRQWSGNCEFVYQEP